MVKHVSKVVAVLMFIVGGIPAQVSWSVWSPLSQRISYKIDNINTTPEIALYGRVPVDGAPTNRLITIPIDNSKYCEYIMAILLNVHVGKNNGSLIAVLPDDGGYTKIRISFVSSFGSYPDLEKRGDIVGIGICKANAGGSLPAGQLMIEIATQHPFNWSDATINIESIILPPTDINKQIAVDFILSGILDYKGDDSDNTNCFLKDAGGVVKGITFQDPGTLP